MATATNLERVGDMELAIAANNLFAKYFESRMDERLSDVVEQFRATGRRLGLLGNVMEVKGKTLAGADFDLTQYKGKVVLVDFWATWCGPCLAELPHVKELYESYKGKGFDVVGISLDDSREVLDEFLKTEQIAWVTLFPEQEEQMGWNNPIARHYGVSGIPTAILIDQAGKVVSLEARGRELTAQLERLLGPADPKPAGEEAPKSE
ncbi:MAG: TlpA family protein disulfide reductase [Planctomyces sp.]|nr:TlpA family protein disulfide reductase [Planctomyces sp.]